MDEIIKSNHVSPSKTLSETDIIQKPTDISDTYSSSFPNVVFRHSRNASVSKYLEITPGEDISLSSYSSSKQSIHNDNIISSEDLIMDKFIGCGSYGHVYFGYYQDEPVAIKLITSCSKSQQRDKEASYLSRLGHHNIVTFYGMALLHDVETASSSLAIIMEMAHGGPLNRIVEKKPILSPEILFDWSQQIVSGMVYLHNIAKIHHRDLKTANILIREPICGELSVETLRYKNLLISDFGMASDASKPFNRDSKVGTVAYSAPEVHRQENFYQGSDVWSFGVILWELLCLDTPYATMEPAIIRYHVGQYQNLLFIPESLDSYNHSTFIDKDDIEIPSVFRDLLSDCWNHKPSNRPTFEVINERLCEARKEKFMLLPAEELSRIQENWRSQIARFIQQFSRESTLSRASDDYFKINEQDRISLKLDDFTCDPECKKVRDPWDYSSEDALDDSRHQRSSTLDSTQTHNKLTSKSSVKKKTKMYSGIKKLFTSPTTETTVNSSASNSMGCLDHEEPLNNRKRPTFLETPKISGPMGLKHLLHVDTQTGLIQMQEPRGFPRCNGISVDQMKHLSRLIQKVLSSNQPQRKKKNEWYDLNQIYSEECLDNEDNYGYETDDSVCVFSRSLPDLLDENESGHVKLRPKKLEISATERKSNTLDSSNAKDYQKDLQTKIKPNWRTKFSGYKLDRKKKKITESSDGESSILSPVSSTFKPSKGNNSSINGNVKDGLKKKNLFLQNYQLPVMEIAKRSHRVKSQRISHRRSRSNEESINLIKQNCVTINAVEATQLQNLTLHPTWVNGANLPLHVLLNSPIPYRGGFAEFVERLKSQLQKESPSNEIISVLFQDRQDMYSSNELDSAQVPLTDKSRPVESVLWDSFKLFASIGMLTKVDSPQISPEFPTSDEFFASPEALCDSLVNSDQDLKNPASNISSRLINMDISCSHKQEVHNFLVKPITYDPREGIDPWEIDENLISASYPQNNSDLNRSIFYSIVQYREGNLDTQSDWNPVAQKRDAFHQATRDGILNTGQFDSSTINFELLNPELSPTDKKNFLTDADSEQNINHQRCSSRTRSSTRIRRQRPLTPKKRQPRRIA